MIISSCKRKVTLENFYQRERGRERQTHTRIYTYINIYTYLCLWRCVWLLCEFGLCVRLKDLCNSFLAQRGNIKYIKKLRNKYITKKRRWIYIYRKREDKERRDKRYPSFPSLINLPTVLVRHHFSSLSFYFIFLIHVVVGISYNQSGLLFVRIIFEEVFW